MYCDDRVKGLMDCVSCCDDRGTMNGLCTVMIEE